MIVTCTGPATAKSCRFLSRRGYDHGAVGCCGRVRSHPAEITMPISTSCSDFIIGCWRCFLFRRSNSLPSHPGAGCHVRASEHEIPHLEWVYEKTDYEIWNWNSGLRSKDTIIRCSWINKLIKARISGRFLLPAVQLGGALENYLANLEILVHFPAFYRGFFVTLSPLTLFYA